MVEISKGLSSSESHERLKSFDDFKTQLEKAVGLENLDSAYKEIARTLKTPTTSKNTFNIEHNTEEKTWLLRYNRKVIGEVHAKKQLVDIVHRAVFASGDTKTLSGTVEKQLDAIIEVRDIVDTSVAKKMDKVEEKVDKAGKVKGFTAEKKTKKEKETKEETNSLDIVLLDGKPAAKARLKDHEKAAIGRLVEDARSGKKGPFVWVKGERDGYVLEQQGNGYILKELDEKLPKQKTFNGWSKAYKEISKKANKFGWIVAEDLLSVPFAMFLDNIREAQDWGVFKRLFARKNKFTNQQLGRLEAGFTELLDLANDTSELKGIIMETYGNIPDVHPTTVISILEQQTRGSKHVGITSWLKSELFDFDGRNLEKMIRDEVASSTEITPETPPISIAAYLEVKPLDIENKDFAAMPIDQLVIGYQEAIVMETAQFESAEKATTDVDDKEKEATPKESIEGDMLAAAFRVALAKRMLSNPASIDEIRAAGNFSSDDLHQMINFAYGNESLIKEFKQQQSDGSMKKIFEESPLLRSKNTSDPAAGVKTSLYFNSFAKVHELPYGNIHAAFSEIYPQDFTTLAENIDGAVNLHSALSSMGLDAIGEKGITGAGFDRLAANTNMTTEQAAGWKKFSNLAIVGVVLYQVLRKGLIKGEWSGGRRATIATMIGAQFASQALTGEGILSFGDKLLNGGLDDMEILGLTGKDKENTKKRTKQARAHENHLPYMGAAIFSGAVLGNLTVDEAKQYISAKTSSDGKVKYTLADKAGLKARHTDALRRTAPLNAKDAEINKRLNISLNDIDLASQSGDVLIGDLLNNAALNKHKEIQRRILYKEEINILNNQLAPYELETDTEKLYYSEEEHTATKERLEEVIGMREKFAKRTLENIPGLTDEQLEIIKFNHLPGNINPVLNKYIRGEIDETTLHATIATVIAVEDTDLAGKIEDVLDGTTSFESLRVVGMEKMIVDLEREMTEKGEDLSKTGLERNLRLSTDGKHIRSYNRAIAFDMTARTLTHKTGIILDLGLTSDEEVLKVANVINALIANYKGKVKPDFIKYLRKVDKPFTFTEVGQVTGKPGIEVDIFDGLNVGLWDPEILSYEGMSRISPELASQEGRKIFLKFLNELYEEGVFTIPEAVS